MKSVFLVVWHWYDVWAADGSPPATEIVRAFPTEDEANKFVTKACLWLKTNVTPRPELPRTGLRGTFNEHKAACDAIIQPWIAIVTEEVKLSPYDPEGGRHAADYLPDRIDEFYRIIEVPFGS